MQEVTAYTCDFCPKLRRKLYLTDRGVKWHENRCFHNPKNRACAGCGNLNRNPELRSGHETAFPDGGPVCMVDAFKQEIGEPSWRSDCAMWAPKPVEGG